MRHPMDRRRRLTDGTRWRTFMRLLLLNDLMTSYTNARPGAGGGLPIFRPCGSILSEHKLHGELNYTVVAQCQSAVGADIASNLSEVRGVERNQVAEIHARDGAGNTRHAGIQVIGEIESFRAHLQ